MSRSGRGSRKIGGDTAMQKSPTRRSVTAGLALGALAAPGLRIAPAWAQAKSVKMAMIAPLSGPWARQGQLLRQGAEMAIDEINQKGGIEKLGGAKFELVVADAGDNTEKAKNAAQRLLSDQPDLIGGFGAWLSSFTLAITEVTERAQLPWLTLSYSDAITNRGFKFIFQTSPTADWQAAETLPTAIKLAEAATGKRPKTVGNGAPFGSPELLKTIGPELLEGLLFSVANWPLKGQEEFIERFKKRTGEPFATQDALCGYGHTWILKEALENAGAPDKLKVADAIRKMNLTTGPAALSFPGPIRFDERGRRQDVPMIFAQWQKGVPVAVYPEDRALAKPFWPSV